MTGCGPRANDAATSQASAQPGDSSQPQAASVPPRLQYAMGIEDAMARNSALAVLFTEWIKGDIQSLNTMLAGWPRDDARWSRVLPALTQVLPAWSERIGKEPALVHLLSLTSGAYAKVNPVEAASWAHVSFGRAGQDVAFSVIVEEMALMSPEQAMRLTDEIGDSVIRLDAIYGIAGSLGAAKREAAFAWVATLPAENQPDAMKAAIEGWAHVNPGDALTYAIREKIPGGIREVFLRWGADAPGNAALAARALADPKARASAVAVVIDAIEQALPVDGHAGEWSGRLPQGAGRDAVNALIAGSQATTDPGEAWQITAAIDEEKTRDEARRSVIVAVDPDIARKLIDGDGKLPAAEAAELRGLIAGRSPAAAAPR